MLLLVVHIRTKGMTTYVCSFCLVMVFVLLTCWDWILVVFSPLGIVFSYVLVLIFFPFCQNAAVTELIMIFSSLVGCKALFAAWIWIVDHDAQLELSNLARRRHQTCKKEGFYIISENIIFICTPLDVPFLQIQPIYTLYHTTSTKY